MVGDSEQSQNWDRGFLNGWECNITTVHRVVLYGKVKLGEGNSLKIFLSSFLLKSRVNNHGIRDLLLL